MWAIRNEQIEVFATKARQKFDDDMVAHLQAFAPEHAKGMGEERLRQFIDLGLQRANAQSFTQLGAVRFFLECMIMFGSYFDTDPQLPWAAECMRATAKWDELARADHLHAAAMEYCERVMGPDYELEAAAIQRVLDDASDPWTIAPDDPVSDILGRVQRYYPEKSAAVGPRPLSEFVRLGLLAAPGFGMPPREGAALITAGQFMFGHGVIDDPQFHWFLVALAGQPGDEPRDRFDNAVAKTLGYLSASLKLLNGGS